MKYLRYIVTTLIVTLLFGVYFYYLTFSGQVSENPVSSAIVSVFRPYPKLTDSKEITLTCDYHGKDLTVSETLYGSLDKYYSSDPAKKTAYLHNQEKDFVFSYEKDNTIKDLADKISAVGSENGLTSDQTLDLSACFLQSIPYDEAKAAKILGSNFSNEPIDEVIPRYPYETLFDQTGICTDKTYLGAAVMSELGYKTAILTFDSQKHMSLGVAVPDGYGSLGTDYGIMELTGSGFLVGDVPELNASAGSAINNFQIISGEDSTATQALLQLEAPNEVIDVSSGTVYSRIVDRTDTRQKLEELKSQLTALQSSYKEAQSVLTAAEKAVTAAENAFNSNQTRANYNAYLTAYDQYLAAYNDAQSKINQYNIEVNLYNSYVQKYRQF